MNSANNISPSRRGKVLWNDTCIAYHVLLHLKHIKLQTCSFQEHQVALIFVCVCTTRAGEPNAFRVLLIGRFVHSDVCPEMLHDEFLTRNRKANSDYVLPLGMRVSELKNLFYSKSNQCFLVYYLTYLSFER